MTQEEKELLLKDISARLPHKQKVCYKIHDNSEEITETLSGCLLDYFKTGKIAVVKPYLRPMSSMTEEERKEFTELMFISDPTSYGYLIEHILFAISTANAIDWFNTHHFDYRGLIEKGLALEAPEGMYNTKTE